MGIFFVFLYQGGEQDEGAHHDISPEQPTETRAVQMRVIDAGVIGCCLLVVGYWLLVNRLCVIFSYSTS